MNKYFLLFPVVIIAGIIVIFITSYSGQSKAVPSSAYLSTLYNSEPSSPSDLDTILDPELSYDEVEPEIYNKDQLYFKYADGMYNYLRLGQVDKIKERLQFFIKNNISLDIRECEFDIDSIDNSEAFISFTVKIPGKSSLFVKYNKNLEDINISQID